MARISKSDYLIIHARLRQLWLDHQRAYRLLTRTDQWHLHDFFRPAHDLPDADLFTYRIRVTQERPGLPQDADRARAKLKAQMRTSARQTTSSHPVMSASRQSFRDLRLEVYGLVNPDLSAEAFLNLLLDIAQDNGRRDVPRLAISMDDQDLHAA